MTNKGERPITAERLRRAKTCPWCHERYVIYTVMWDWNIRFHAKPAPKCGKALQAWVAKNGKVLPRGARLA